MNNKIIPEQAIVDIGNKLYDDLGHPVFAETGIFLQGILKFISLPFKFLGITAEQLEEKYKEFIMLSINKVPVEKRCNPDPYMICPLLDHVKYYFNEDSKSIYDMFSELLSKSINTIYKDEVHPIFLDILRRMSPIDAEVFKKCFTKDDSCFLLEYYTMNEKYNKTINIELFLIDIETREDSKLKYQWENLRKIYEELQLIGIVEEGSHYQDYVLKEIYDNFKMKDIKYGTKESYAFTLSEIGKRFKRICLTEE